MIYTEPDYYKNFKCIADKCEATCCAGWQIVIDDASMQKYKKMKGDYIWKVMACVDWENEIFRQDKEKRCAFLNKENLCNLYINAGEEMLCKTCREYPRHIEEFEGVRETTLSVSCPVVARMLMERTTPVQFISYETQEEEMEVFEEFDPFLFSILEDARKEMIAILQNRTLPMENRGMLVLAMAHDIQIRMNHSQMFDCSAVIEKYKTSKAAAYIKAYLEKRDDALEEQRAKKMFEILYKLEMLRDKWKDVLKQTQTSLFKKGDYSNIRKQFQAWKQAHPEIEIHLEQIFVYFLFTYFAGAVYDGEVFAKAQMSAYCTWMLELLWMAKFVSNGKELSLDERISLLYQFSREVEHSDENLRILDKMMEKKRLFS